MAEVAVHDCLDHSGVIVCGKTEPHHDYPWMDRPVTSDEIAALFAGEEDDAMSWGRPE